ncbi:DUF1801 domain-containing protein [Litorilituus sediminis]|uniref:DUF1801 domain-containing protein n=1 Tax=Litorilituus sediminis TaxID=718192 RepID=A0A4P6P1G0_9GAMM|nr:DUF1801 domain-containing protein [Litorilituus sediminis]QBG34863.1 DUF1801 domain-containing protein [Litorilituus sediminis]
MGKLTAKLISERFKTINSTSSLQALICHRTKEYIGAITETLKWGEPSYISPVGSTIRLGWKKQTPDNYYVYFHCKTSIIETIKEVYGEKFSYQGNRALVFNINQTLNNATLAHCLSLSLKYKKIKHLPLLGM